MQSLWAPALTALCSVLIAPKWMRAFMESSHVESAVVLWKIHKTPIQRIFITTHNSFQCLTCSHTAVMHISMNCIFRDGLRWCHFFFFIFLDLHLEEQSFRWTDLIPKKKKKGLKTDLRSENVFEQIAPFYMCNYLIIVENVINNCLGPLFSSEVYFWREISGIPQDLKV